jgi:hypothetical protein
MYRGEDVPEVLRQPAWDLHNAVIDLGRVGSEATQVASGSTPEEVIGNGAQRREVVSLPQTREALVEMYRQSSA